MGDDEDFENSFATNGAAAAPITEPTPGTGIKMPPSTAPAAMDPLLCQPFFATYVVPAHVPVAHLIGFQRLLCFGEEGVGPADAAVLVVVAVAAEAVGVLPMPAT